MGLRLNLKDLLRSFTNSTIYTKYSATNFKDSAGDDNIADKFKYIYGLPRMTETCSAEPEKLQMAEILLPPSLVLARQLTFVARYQNSANLKEITKLDLFKCIN